MKRRVVLIAATAILATVATLVALWQLSRARCFVLGGEVTCRVETTQPLVALTFDDGPTQLGVDAVLPVLERHGAKATFFLVGEAMEKRPDLAGRLAAAGHEIANHSATHRQMVLHTPGWYDQELARTQRALTAAGGTSRLFRPPYGKKLTGLPQALDRAGLTMVTWDIEEPTTTDPATYAREIVDQARPGSIIIIHPMFRTGEQARQALPLILTGLKAKGLRPVTASELIDGATAPGSGRGSGRSPP